MLKGVSGFTAGGTLPSPVITGNADFTGATRLAGLWRDVARSQIPLIGLSSGSVAANGAISGITALPQIYPRAFCYFPANILATAIAAGWYYCTFSSTTAGVAFLNSWTPGTAPPTIPTSPTAVTDGKGAFTGDTSEQQLIIPIAAGALGANGQIEVFARSGHTNSAGTKTFRIRFGGAAGLAYLQATQTTTIFGHYYSVIGNAGTEATQEGSGWGVISTGTAFGQVTQLGTVDTTAATDVRIANVRNTATDNAVIEAFYVRLAYGS